MRKILKFIGYSILGLTTFMLLYFVFALLLSLIPMHRNQVNGHDIDIYILSNGIHTDLVVPVKTKEIDWSQQIKHANTSEKDTTAIYLALGWGDKDFFLETPDWNDLNACITFKAIVGWNTSAMHTTFISSIQESKQCIKLGLSNMQYRQLIAFIQNSFKRNQKNEFKYIQTDKNYGKNDAFYESTGHLSLFNTCNTWTNKALKACGQKACIWTPFEKGIFFQYN